MLLDARAQETKEWLGIAKTDLAASRNLALNDTFASQASFHAQQSAEKALKAFLVWHQERFKKDHDIRYLGDLVLKKDPSLTALIDEAVSLNPYAVTTRYPGFSEEIGADEVADAIKIAEKVYNEILARLPKELCP